MYARARLRMTASFAVAFLAVLLLLGVGTYVGLVWALDREIDSGIEAVVDGWRASAPPLESLPELDIDEHDDEQTADTFLLVFRTDGALVLNSRLVEADDFAERHIVREAFEGETHWGTFSEHGVRYRVHIAPVREGRQVVGAIVGGRSLTARDQNVRLIAGVLGVVAAGGFILALGAAYLLAGRALAPLQLAYDRQRAFVSDASHELRSPITLIRALAELLQRGRLDSDQRETVDEIVAVTDDSAVLIDDLLTLARTREAGPEDRDAAPHADLAEVAARVLDQMAPLLFEHRTEVERGLAPVKARMPAVEASRVLRALLDNVLAHTPPGTRVRVTTGTSGRFARLAVVDDGPGVPEEESERIFERFAQLDAARTPGRGGAGLGLAIVAALVRERGGSVEARRSAWGGLEVAVRIPGA